MFGSIKKHFNNLVSSVSQVTHKLQENFSLSTRIGESLRRNRQVEDFNLDQKALMRDLGIHGKSARDMMELIFKSSESSGATVTKKVEMDPVGRHSGEYTRTSDGAKFLITPREESEVAPEKTVPKIIRLNAGLREETLMLTLASGEMIRIQTVGGKISLAMRSLDNAPSSQINRVIDKSQFAKLLSCIQASYEGDDSKIKQLIQFGHVTVADSILGMPAQMHEHSAELIHNNSPALQQKRREALARQQLGLAT